MGGRVLRVITRVNRGGPARQLEALIPGLAQAGWTGPVVHGACPAHEPDARPALERVGAELVTLPSLTRTPSAFRDARAIRDLVGVMRQVKPDVVHSHMGKAGALARVAAWHARIPVVHTLHGHHFDRPGLRGRAARRAERLLGRLTTRLVCLSRSQWQDVVERHRIVPAERAALIGPGFAVEPFASLSRADVRQGEVLWTGRLVAVKRPFALLDLAEDLPATARLVVVGTGPLKEPLARAVAERGLTDRVELVGAVEDVRPYLARAAVFVLPSASEGTPLSLLEAMVAGVPVVATDVGGVGDLLQMTGAGSPVRAADRGALAQAVRRILDAPGEAGRQAEQAAYRARALFGPSRLVEGTAALYEGLRGGAG